MEIQYPDGYDDLAEIEHEAKGHLFGVRVRIGSQVLEFNFYDPVRLAQEIKSDLESGGYFHEGSIVVVELVTRAHMENALRKLHQSAI